MIVDGQRVRALESNAAWASKTVNNTFIGQQTLNKAGSGPQITDVQQKINDIDADVTAVESDVSTLQSDVANLQGLNTFVYVGLWDASTNTPALADGDGALPDGIGSTYRVSVAGTQDLGSGSVTYAVGDKLVYNTLGVWERWDTTDEIQTLDDLSDVTLTAPAIREVLSFDGAAWINKNLDSTANDASTGSNQTLSAVSASVIRLTNASLVSVNMIPAGFSGQKFILINATGVTVTISEELGATPANRILTGTGADLQLIANANLWLTYDSSSSRWRVVGGSGAGGFVGFQETLGGTVNGVNVTFGPLTYVPANDESIQIFVDGVLLAFSDWTKSGSNIVLDVAPTSGQSVYAFYITGGGVALPSISGVLKTEYRVVTLGEATANQLTLANSPAVPGDVQLDIIGVGPQFYTDDFTVSGAVLSVTSGLLVDGDRVRIVYVY